MQSSRRQLLIHGLKFFDLAVIGVAVVLGAAAYSQRMNFNFAEVLALRLKLSNVMLFAALLGVSQMILRAAGLYDWNQRPTGKAEVRDILRAVTICALMFTAAAVAFKIEVVASRSFLVTFWTISAGVLITSRMTLRSALTRLQSNGRHLRHVLIVGTNSRATQVARRIESKPELGYALVGFADDPWPGLQSFRALGYPVVTDLRHLSKFLRESVVDEMFICLPLKSYYERVREIVERCEIQGIIVRLFGHIFDLRVAQAKAEMFEDETVVSLYNGRMKTGPQLAKRAFDVAASLAVLVLLSPVLLATAAAIKLTSSGAVFFTQERVGVNKRRFRMFKFRTMVVDAEWRQRQLEAGNEVGGPVFKIRNDPRITPLGRFLRKTSIDELPQLLNVLNGDMSLVGPRPLPIRDVNGFDKDWHRRRFCVRPGITCLWQVSGRSAIAFDRWMELDLQYIDEWSLWLDFKILVRTVPAVLKGTGAA